MQSIRRIIMIIFTVATAAVLVSCMRATPKGEDTTAKPDTSPSFGTQAIEGPHLPVRVAIQTIQLPEGSGGNGDLGYTLTPIPAGLSFDPASRVVSGMPTTVGVYPMSYTVADEDDDVATLAFTITVAHAMVYWVDIEDGAGTIWSAHLDGSNAKRLVTVSGAEPHGIALDVPGGKMYWVELTPGKVRRANLDGSGEEDLVSDGSSRPRSIALDVTGGKMYWTDNGTHSVRHANLDGSGVEDIVTGLAYGTAIALDLTDGMMYWIDDAADKIQRANLDGSGIRDIVISNLAAPHGLAVDHDSGKLYWTHRRTGEITRANLDGSGIESIVIDESAGEPNEIDLDLINQKMYWTEQEAGGTVRRANLDGSNIETLVSGLTEPYGIALH